MSPCIHNQFIFDHTIKTKNSLLNKQCEENWISICRNLKQTSALHPVQKPAPNNLQNRRGTFQDTDISKDFLDKAPKTQAIIAKIDIWDHSKLGHFHTAKDMISKCKATYSMGANICK